MEIFRCFHSGSPKLQQDCDCNLPEMRWLGIDLCQHVGDLRTMNQAVSLTSRDRARAMSMLSRPGIQEHGVQNMRQKRMLQNMLMLGVKLEIQALDQAADRGLCGWLEGKMLRYAGL